MNIQLQQYEKLSFLSVLDIEFKWENRDLETFIISLLNNAPPIIYWKQPLMQHL